MERNLSIHKGQIIYLEPRSVLYKSTYETQVIDITERHLRTSMPYQDGKLVLLGVGTLLKVIINPGTTFYSEVIDRCFSPQPGLTLATPWSLTNSGRRTRVIAVTSGKGGVGNYAK